MAITMKNLNDRIATLEGKAATTPITMKGLADRLANLEATAKKWEEVTIQLSNVGLNLIGNFDTKFDSYKYAILSISFTCDKSGQNTPGMSINVNTSTASASANNNVNAGSATITKTSGKFTFKASNGFVGGGSLKVLFYK